MSVIELLNPMNLTCTLKSGSFSQLSPQKHLISILNFAFSMEEHVLVNKLPEVEASPPHLNYNLARGSEYTCLPSPFVGYNGLNILIVLKYPFYCLAL